MRRYLSLLLVLAFLISAGCVEEYTPETTNATTTPAAVTLTSAITATPSGPTPVPTPPPAEMAYLVNIKCAVGDRSEAAYHCGGDIQIRRGVYEEVQVIARYPDNNTYRSGTFGMGGSNQVSRPFLLFPDLKYQGQSPDYFVRMDKTVYPVISGVAWSNLPEEKQLANQGRW
jgi:hypothetical protein